MYSELHTLKKVAERIGRSSSGIYKILRQESCPITPNAKVRSEKKDEIVRLYYRECLSANEVANRTGLSKTTVHYWLRKLDSPIPDSLRIMSGSRAVVFFSHVIDLLPFVEASHLRWANTTSISLRFANSHTAVLPRLVDARRFVYILGLYLAEGNKGKGPPAVRNTQPELLAQYHAMLRSIVRSEFHLYHFPAVGNRLAQDEVRVGGECIKRLFINGIEAILSFFSGQNTPLDAETLDIGLSFLRGCADGDGSISRSKQIKSKKMRMTFYLTEAREPYALKLKDMFRKVLGSSRVYRPRNRNYYLVISSLSPERSVLLLTHKFFSYHPEMRRRLAVKVLDSRYLTNFVRLHSLFGTLAFSVSDLAKLAPDIHADFIGRAVVRKQLLPCGVAPSGIAAWPRWHRLYRLADNTLEMTKCVAEWTKGGTQAIDPRTPY